MRRPAPKPQAIDQTDERVAAAVAKVVDAAPPLTADQCALLRAAGLRRQAAPRALGRAA